MLDSKSFIGKKVEVTIDRPLGSKHPRYDWVYPLNYGFIEGIKNSDGEELDAYVLGIKVPVDKFAGNCVAVIHRIDDDDDKLIVVSENKDFTDEEIKKQTDFQERFYHSEIWRK
jgi:inorganic pyrophosphatase